MYKDNVLEQIMSRSWGDFLECFQGAHGDFQCQYVKKKIKKNKKKKHFGPGEPLPQATKIGVKMP